MVHRAIARATMTNTAAFTRRSPAGNRSLTGSSDGWGVNTGAEDSHMATFPFESSPTAGREVLPVSDSWASLTRDLETLADVLPFLLSRDDERPATWLSPEFDRQVAAIRSRVSTIVNRRLLAARLGPDANVSDGSRFEQAARRLASDANAVALAVRWIEIQGDQRLPSWPEVLRRQAFRATSSAPATTGDPHWFG
jgi:hypothetical protein